MKTRASQRAGHKGLGAHVVLGGSCGLLASSLLAAWLLVPAGCGPYCRDIPTRELDISCEDGTNRFQGELHFDSAAVFETFLSQQCLPSTSETDRQAIIDSVDWSTKAVFAASGPPNIDSTRCVEDRSLERAQVCSDGLKIYFRDVYTNSDFGCAGPRWTVAFELNREDLRAALEAGEAIDVTVQ